jgi:hypothetical protein
MKVFLAALIAVLLLSLMDQRFNDGRYTWAAKELASQLMRASG